jgi:CHAT domain-containing protein/predicted negative regulator of RcsB-dependent stress response
LVQAAWLAGCGDRERAAEAAYSEAQSAYLKGDFPISLEKSREGLRKWAPRSFSWGWKFRLLCAENLISTNQVKEAGPLLDAVPGPRADLMARWKLDRANVLASQPEKAREFLYDARKLAAASGDYTIICLANLRLGALAAYAEAEAYYHAALAAAEHQGDPYLVTRARLALGYNRVHARRFDEAVPFLDQALATGHQCGAKHLIATALGNLGACYLHLGDLDRAMETLTRAEKLLREMGMRDYEQRVLALIGDIYLARGDFDRALAVHHRAEELAREVHNDESLGFALNNQAEASLAKGDLAAAQRFNDQALIVKRRLNDPRSLVYSEKNAANLEALGGQYRQAEQHYAAVALAARNAGEFNVVWEAHGGLASLYRQTGRHQQAEAQYRDAIDTIDREWNKLSDEWKVTFLAPDLIHFFQDYVDFLIERGQPETALEMAESSRARVLNQRLERQGDVPAAFRLATLRQAAQAAHTVILSYWLAPRRSSVWVIGSGPLARFDLPADKDIERLVQKYMDTVLADGDPLARHDPVAEALYQAVLGPVYKLVPPGANVIVVPDGALDRINFETLVVAGPRPHYWIEDAAIATAPSLRLLTGDTQDRARAPRLLLMGDPVLVGPEFPPLPNVKKEIAAVQEQFPPLTHAVFTGADAVPERYAGAGPANFTAIHFATHATANRESPLNSAIILSHHGESFKLYARDVAQVPLRAELVTISACHSAGAKTYSGEGLMGFAWAFLQAGAQNVIASLWDVDDAGSVLIMRHLYAEIAAGQPPARALRAAKLALMRSSDRYKPPYFWGALQVFTRRIERSRADR